MKNSLAALTVFCLLIPSIHADEYTLPPIIKEASPVELLDQDPIVPPQKTSIELTTGNGSVIQSIQDQLPFAVTNPGRAGGLNQFRGMGASAEETSVESLGIPLNYPQGGGFDFSTFPQFFWQEFQFTESPSVGGLDPRGVAGTVALVPWTAHALEAPPLSKDHWESRWTGMYSDVDLTQLSVGGKYGDRLAVLAGVSSGQVNGPTASLSTLVYDSGSTKVKFHFLATDVNETLYGFGSPQPNLSDVVRLIPVAQIDAAPAENVTLKSSVFYDNTYLRSDTYGSSLFTRDRAQQVGVENALVDQGWKLGAGARHVGYAINGVFVPDETITHASLSRTLSLSAETDSRLILDPVIEEVSDSGFSGPFPQGSLGLRDEWSGGSQAIFARGTFSRRFPSLADRYYTTVGALANPALTPESDWTAIAGFETHQGIWSGLLQGFYQIRDNAQAPIIIDTNDTVQQQNVGRARVSSLLAQGGVELSPQVKVSNAFTWNHSHSDGLNNRFPLLPDFINLTTLTLTPAPKWTVDLVGRAQSDAFSSPFTPNAPLAGTAFGDIQVSYDWTPSLRLIGRADNFTGESLVLYPGYPPQGRVISIAAIGQL